ncbi:hypothetical protein D9M68_311190 [compost metagenome]
MQCPVRIPIESPCFCSCRLRRVIGSDIVLHRANPESPVWSDDAFIQSISRKLSFDLGHDMKLTSKFP